MPRGAAVATITTTITATASSGVQPSATAVRPSASVAAATARRPKGKQQKVNKSGRTRWTPEEDEKLKAIFPEYPNCRNFCALICLVASGGVVRRRVLTHATHSDTNEMLQNLFPGRTVYAVRVRIRNCWAKKPASKVSCYITWTEKDFQTYMSHPSRFYGVFMNMDCPPLPQQAIYIP